MSITTVSSRKFNQDVSKIKKAAKLGPVFITDRGKTSHVLLNFKDYQKLNPSLENIVESLSMPKSFDIDFIFPKISCEMYRKNEI